MGRAGQTIGWPFSLWAYGQGILRTAAGKTREI